MKANAFSCCSAPPIETTEVFEDPHEFNADRNPHLHMGFGAGAHTCLGQHLARVLLEVGLREFLPTVVPDYEVQARTAERRRTNHYRPTGAKVQRGARRSYKLKEWSLFRTRCVTSSFQPRGVEYVQPNGRLTLDVGNNRNVRECFQTIEQALTG